MWGASGVTVELGDTRALADVDVAAPPGEVTMLVGGDGAGKTTLLRALLGRVAVTSGSVRMPDAARLGYQPSSSGVWPNLSVAENVEFVGRAYGLTSNEVADRSRELLGGAGLDGARDRLGRQLSGGMRQKLGFCLAMLHAPEVLLLDEPSTGVDPVSRVELWRLVARAATRGAAVVMTTTYLDEAERATTVLAMDAGRVLASGDPRDVVRSVPGSVTVSRRRPPARGAGAGGEAADLSWRRGTRFHTWTPPRADPPRGEPVEPDLEDALIVLTLASQTTGATR